jgi:glycosyltransferase involved in cell wall biosynthesis
MRRHEDSGDEAIHSARSNVMRVTVGICTWNRARLLDRTLTQMRQLAIPAGVEWEVLVTNNNCTDTTDEVISRHADCLPLRRLFEPMPGKSHALNAAVATIDSELILWTDDDVLVGRDWLAAYVTAAHDWPQASYFGGPIEPWFDAAPPHWLTAAWPHIAGAYAAREFGDEPFELDLDSLPFGANFAIRTPVQRRYLYNPRLGRRERGMLAGEESEVLLRLVADGHCGYWVPQSRVRHYIVPERLSLNYLRRYFYGLGQTEALMHEPPPHAKPRRRMTLAKDCWRAAVSEAKSRLGRPFRGPDWWIKHLTRSSFLWGRLAMQRHLGPRVL